MQALPAYYSHLPIDNRPSILSIPTRALGSTETNQTPIHFASPCIHTKYLFLNGWDGGVHAGESMVSVAAHWQIRQTEERECILHDRCAASALLTAFAYLLPRAEYGPE